MDPVEALRQIFQQINDLSGGGLDMLDEALGGGGAGGGGAAPEGEEVPAPPGATGA
ncbi:hypothetical protein SEA_MOLEFICENT_34 [Microbacterium phage Moleficent]|nr:hypothetical protein HWD33_gp34 [Microbacterium phage Phedro]QFG04957.1 hypothetical protein SEA_PHRIEDRICE_35 [Microbacterium phage PhriedRice]QJD52886.1 hypothetical protein SEA_PHRACTURED_34 [Microbacterium phage Phractured]QJD52996.1 hypothetical protein SEA_PHARKY_34 [Microbacterium phage Pharky]QNL30337.1 hypothetical protein SEA_MAZUN_35 [Microbacterium phage Mazun]QWY82726.1 hypothetical protein SEA_STAGEPHRIGHT_34 [Microbacterium phage StagePhright]UXE04123.1 hypothetical protein 